MTIYGIARKFSSPVTARPGTFIALTLSGAAAPIAATVCGGHIYHFLAYAGTQSAVAAYLLCLLLAAVKSRTVTFITLGLMTCAAIVECCHIIMLSRPVDADTISLIRETTATEATGFFKQYLSGAVLLETGLFIIAIATCALIGNRLFNRIRLRFHDNRAFSIVTAAALATLIIPGIIGSCTCLSILRVRTYDDLIIWYTLDDEHPDRARKYRMEYSDAFTKSVYIAKSLHLENDNIDRWVAIQKDFIASAPVKAATDSVDIVVIIGESYIKAHSSAYGYRLNTNPALTREIERGNITMFHDMITTANFTTQSIRNLLNLNSLCDDQPWYESLYLPLVMKRAGFSVGLFSNQYSANDISVGLPALYYPPEITDRIYDSTADTCFRYDGIFTEHISRRITASAARSFTVWHLMGQHFPAADRFPASHRRFKASDITSADYCLTDERRAQVATLYNDSVICAIIDLYRHRTACLIYFSDHGEELWDMAPFGARNAQYPDDPEWLHRQFDIPFFIWLSDKFIAARPETTARIKAAGNRPGMLDNIGQIVLHVAGIDNHELYRPQRDILSDSYKCPPRITSAGYEYDRITGHDI